MAYVPQGERDAQTETEWFSPICWTTSHWAFALSSHNQLEEARLRSRDLAVTTRVSPITSLVEVPLTEIM